MPLRNGTRMLGRTVYDSGTSERPLDTYSQVDRSMDRMQFGAKVDFENDWVLDMSYTRSVFNQQRTELQDTQSVEFELAINGMGGPNCDPFNGTAGSGNAAYAASGGDFGAGNCYYFNPFGNAYINPDGTRQTDLTLVNLLSCIPTCWVELHLTRFMSKMSSTRLSQEPSVIPLVWRWVCSTELTLVAPFTMPP